MAEQTFTAEQLKSAIAARYEFPEWQVESEVTMGGRRLDVVALNLWGARRYRIVGFEIKVSRGDWMRELAQFQKAEEWIEVVDAFFVVTPPKLVRPDELPTGWGLLEFTGSKMMTKQMPTPREPQRTLPRQVAARFLTRIGESSRAKIREADWRREHDLEQKIRAEVTARLEKQQEERLASLREDSTNYRELLAALGLNSHWRPQEHALRAAAVFANASGDVSRLRGQLDVTIGSMKQHVERLEGARAAIEQKPAEVAHG